MTPNIDRIHERYGVRWGGPQVAQFEALPSADYLGVKHVVGVGSGTDALRLALIAAGVGPGDEVITTPMTFVATAEAIFQAGAVPVFVDVDPDSATISVEGVSRYLEQGEFRTPNGPRAIVPVHLYGLPAAMDRLREVANRYNLAVVEDACQAHGARIHCAGEWKRAGAVSTAGCFSFYPGKNLGAWGEAPGAIATNDDRNWPRASRCCAIMAGFRTTCIRNPDTTREWTRCRRRCCSPNSNAWRNGTRAGGHSRGATRSCSRAAGC